MSLVEFGDLSTNVLQDISRALHDRNYYLLIGSGVSTDSKGINGNLESTSQLTHRLNKEIDENFSFNLPQIYSLLKKDQIEKLLTNPFKCVDPGVTIKRLVQYNWRRVYTFNIDNCFEVAARKWLRERGYNSELVECIHFKDVYSENAAVKVQSIVHLHGSVDRPDDGYVFSHREYARIMTEVNRWMGTLTDLINSSPFIVSGTSLNEIDVEFYLQSRSLNSGQMSSLPSILIEPFPNLLTEKLCADHGFVLFRGDTIDFLNQIESHASEPPLIDLSAFRPTLEVKVVDEEDLLRFEQAFEKVPSNPRIERSSNRFLLGAGLTWSMIAGNSDILRDVTEEIELTISEQRSGNPDLQSFVIFDEAGSGKSALLRRLAFRHAGRSKNVFWLTDSSFVEARIAAIIYLSEQSDGCIK